MTTVTPEPSVEELAARLEAAPAKPGTCVDATVTRVGDDMVHVSFEGGEGAAPLKAFGKPPMPGATVRLYVDNINTDPVRLSLDKAERLDLYDRLQAAQEAGTALRAEVLKVERGGLSVQILGVKAFLPANMLARRPGPLEDWLGKSLDVRILTLEGFKNRIEVATADLPQESADEAKARLLAELAPGQTVEGIVRRLAPFGAFVDLGGFDGLVATSELSWGRLRHPSEAVAVGDSLTVKVLDIDVEKARIGLSLKALLPDPWLTVEDHFPTGSIVEGTVVGAAEYGVFVALAPGLEGLVHVTEIRWGEAPKKPASLVRRGAQVAVKVIEADGAKRRIRLSMKQALDNPWERVRADYPPGTRLRGTVRNVADFGIFIGVTDGIDGLVHASDIAWGRTLRDLKAHYKKGDAVEAMVLNVDVERQRLSLGIKQLTADDSDRLYDGLEVGNIVEGTVVKTLEFGAFVAVADGIEGLVHRSEIADPEPESPAAVLNPGDVVQVLILAVDADAGRVSLSIKQVPTTPEENLAPPGDAIVSPPVSGLVPSVVPPPAVELAPAVEAAEPLVPAVEPVTLDAGTEAADADTDDQSNDAT